MAAAYAAIGNDGIWTTPHIVRSQVDAQGETEVAAVETRQVVSPRHVGPHAGDAGVGDRGWHRAQCRRRRLPGRVARPEPPTSWERTGRYTEETRASFVGMAPISDPKVVVAVVVDAPSYDYRTGGLAAAPVFAEIMEQALHRLGVSPDGEPG